MRLWGWDTAPSTHGPDHTAQLGQLQRGGRTDHRLASPFPSGKDKSSFLGCFQTVDVTLEALPKPWLPTGASPHSVATRSDQTPRVHPRSQEKSRGRAVCSLQPPPRCQLSSPQSRRVSEGRGWGFLSLFPPNRERRSFEMGPNADVSVYRVSVRRFGICRREISSAGDTLG